ncbi:FecR family protein [Flavivirga aquimarina]|uniref:FecR family protein n=1 Tax=Flavivirga aquimarina TaxID=2027862 RepID=A0ABT8W5S6_9FLAO|nr:FecR family protein [Flavivirga aquimarina]MDO5968470.1 FecR family protein [Flavivirga aquimarina]
MSNSNKIRLFSKKLAASLIKNETPDDLERSEIFDEKTKAQMLSDIKTGKYSSLLKEIDAKKDWKALKIKKGHSKKAFKFWSYGIAASIVLLISIGLVVFNKTNQGSHIEAPIVVNNNIETGKNKAILTLEDDSEVTLEKGISYHTDHVTSNGEGVIYQPAGQAGNNKDASKGMVYNTLTVPRGGQFYILLSDGTKVWLNSESKLKYPVSFNKGDTREVELIHGEAYFDVSPSTEHEGAKFKVSHKGQEVEVLGTEFNVKAYKDEASIYTTLVEGKVAVSSASAKETLMPNQQSNLSLKTNNISITEVDVYNEVSWKEGVFSFESMPLKDIMKVLSRWYDMDVTIENNVQKEERFIGTFNKSNSIEDILIAINSTNIINSYEIHDKRLIIK